MTSDDLTLAARDSEDLQIVSARLQDAVAQIGDLVYLPKSRRFVAMFNRYRWEAGDVSRVRAGLTIEAVTACKSFNLKRGEPKAVVSLLAVGFVPAGGEDPGGEIELVFAGGGAIRLGVECVDAALKDLGEPWAARARPDHEGGA